MYYRDMNTDKQTFLDIFHMPITSITFCVRSWLDRGSKEHYEECLLFNDLSNLVAPASRWMLALKDGVVSASSDIANGTLYSVAVYPSYGEIASTWGDGRCVKQAIKSLLLSQCSTQEHASVCRELKHKHHLLSQEVLRSHLP